MGDEDFSFVPTPLSCYYFVSVSHHYNSPMSTTTGNMLLLKYANDPAVAGLLSTLNPEKEEEQPIATEVVDDYEAEQETLLSNSINNEDNEDHEDHEDSEDKEDTEFPQLEDTIRNASKGVTEGTDSEYRRCGSS
jgi:hypothetical protein